MTDAVSAWCLSVRRLSRKASLAERAMRCARHALVRFRIGCITRHWRRATYAFYQIEPQVVHTIQQLGQIDAELFLRDVRHREIQELNNATPGDWDEIADCATTMAYLWVLGAYEVIRLLD